MRRNHYKKLSTFSTAILTTIALLAAFAQAADLSGKVAFVSLSTAKIEHAGGATAVFAPKVLLRLTRDDGAPGFLVMTDRAGTAVFPIEAGRYCAEAFGLDGRPAKLWSANGPPRPCFIAVPGKMIEVGITLAADAIYHGEVPDLGVE